MVSGWQTKWNVSPGPGLWSLVLGPFGPDLGPGLDLTWDLDLSLTILFIQSKGDNEVEAYEELKESLLWRIPSKIHQPLNFWGWQNAAREKQKIILDILRITNDPTYPGLFELYSNVASFAFPAFLPDLTNWALNAFGEGVAIFKFPRAIQQYQELERKIRDAETQRRLNPSLRIEFDVDDDLFVD